MCCGRWLEWTAAPSQHIVHQEWAAYVVLTDLSCAEQLCEAEGEGPTEAGAGGAVDGRQGKKETEGGAQEIVHVALCVDAAQYVGAAATVK